jgi:signal transduction histidine kinase
VEKKLEMLLPQAAKSTFYLILEAVNHDVRNLLLGLESIIHDIQAKTYLKGVDKSHFDFLADRVSFINFSITKLLSLFNFNNQRVQLVDLNRIIKDTSQYFETIRGEDSKKIEFINKLSKSIIEVMCVKQMTMIVYNLFINAVQAIELSSNNRGVLEFFTGIEGDNIVFRIKDNGIGIKDKDIPYIFDAHFSTKNGLGIGLYFVKSLIESEEYNGQITVKSENNFTTFQVSIPSYINFRK